MDLLFILIGAGLAIFVIFVSFKSIGAGIAAKSEINRQKDKLKSGDKEEGIEDVTNENIEKTNEQVKIINQIDDLILIVDKFKNIHCTWAFSVTCYGCSCHKRLYTYNSKCFRF